MSSDFRQMKTVALDKIGAHMARCLANYVVENCANCPMCKHFDEPNELCKLNNLRPPARVIAYGCEKYQP